MSEENKNLNTISEDTANADSNAVAETADKKEDTKAKKNKKNKSEKGRFKKFMKSRKAKHGTVAMAITALVIVMVIATKKIILSIFSGIVISALMIENFQLLPALKNIVEEAVQWAIDTANDSSHGYDQGNRWGPDYDCSSFLTTAYRKAGLSIGGGTAVNTANMRSYFMAAGFQDVTSQVNFRSGSGIIRGDVLITGQKGHTAMSIGDGQVVQASINEFGERWRTDRRPDRTRDLGYKIL